MCSYTTPPIGAFENDIKANAVSYLTSSCSKLPSYLSDLSMTSLVAYVARRKLTTSKHDKNHSPRNEVEFFLHAKSLAYNDNGAGFLTTCGESNVESPPWTPVLSHAFLKSLRIVRIKIGPGSSNLVPFTWTVIACGTQRLLTRHGYRNVRTFSKGCKRGFRMHSQSIWDPA